MKANIPAIACMAAAIALPSIIHAQIAQKSDYILLSDKYGSTGYVGLMPQYGVRSIDDPFDGFQPRALSGADIATLFQKLCLDKPFDAAAYAAAREAVAPDFRPTVRDLPPFSAPKPLLGSFNLPEVSFSQNFSDYGISSLWLGENADKLENRPFARFSGSLIITGPFEAKNSYAPQCNLTLKVSQLDNAKPLLDSIQAALPGYQNLKRVEKPKYGYATWTGAAIGGRVPRVIVNADGLNKPAQIVHLTLQLLPAGIVK